MRCEECDRLMIDWSRTCKHCGGEFCTYCYDYHERRCEQNELNDDDPQWYDDDNEAFKEDA